MKERGQVQVGEKTGSGRREDRFRLERGQVQVVERTGSGRREDRFR